MTQHWCALCTVMDPNTGALFSIAAVTFTSATEIVDEYFARMPNEVLKDRYEPSWSQLILIALAREPPTHRSVEVMVKDFALWYLKQTRRGPVNWLVYDGHISDGWLMREMNQLGVVKNNELPSTLFDVATLLTTLNGSMLGDYIKEKKLPMLVKDLHAMHPINSAVAIGQAYFELKREVAVLLAYSKMRNGNGELPPPTPTSTSLIDFDAIDGVDLLPSKKRTDADIEVGAPPTTPLEPEVKTERMSPPPPRQPSDKKTEHDSNDMFDEDADVDDKKDGIPIKPAAAKRRKGK